MGQALNYIVADDFTGANDIGIGLVNSGSNVSVILRNKQDDGILNRTSDYHYIFCTDSRDDDYSVAQAKIRKIKSESFPRAFTTKSIVEKSGFNASRQYWCRDRSACG